MSEEFLSMRLRELPALADEPARISRRQAFLGLAAVAALLRRRA
jgi:hypothetical protein